MNLPDLYGKIRLIYRAAVEAVKPDTLISSKIRYHNNVLHVGDEIAAELKKNCHVVGQ